MEDEYQGYESPWRKDPTGPHPLFDKMPATYLADQEWRKDIPKAGAR